MLPSIVGPTWVKQSGAVGGATSSTRSVCVLYTGGTIGMRANAAGSLEPSPGYLGSRLSEMPEFRRDEMPLVALYELLPLLDSSDMGPSDWLRLALTIETLYFSYDGGWWGMVVGGRASPEGRARAGAA